MGSTNKHALSRFSGWLHRYARTPYRLYVHDDVGDGPTIILLHGIASSSLSWQYVVPLLAPHYRCIMIDLLGFGQSPKPTWNSYTPKEHLRHIRYTIKKLHLRGPYIIAGHSLGSLLALRYAKQYPKEVERLIMLSPPVYVDPLNIRHRHIRMATNAYFRAYKYLRTHKNFTITNAARITRMLPIPGALALTEETWLPFARSLEECIERQTAVDDIRDLPMPIDIFYGSFDEFIIKANLLTFTDVPQVTVHRLQTRHIISKSYAQSVAKVLLSPVAKH